MSSPAEPPLIDQARLGTLSFFSPEKLQGLFAQVLAAAETVAAAADPASLATAAHTLKGSAGTVGLARIAALAAELEESARQGDANTAARQRLKQVVGATRDELAARGLLAP